MKSSVNLLVLLVIASLMFFGGCKNQNSAVDKSKMPTADAPYAQVYVSKSGLDELDRAIGALAQNHGVVLYSREAPQENEPHPVFKDVLDIVVKNKLPVRLCVNSDCSDALTPDGKLRINN